MGGQDGWTKHQSIVIAAVKILTVFAQIGTIVFPSAFLFGLGIPKALFMYTKTLFFCHPHYATNPLLAIPITPKHFSCYFCNAITLFLLKHSKTVKHFSCHPSYTNTFLATSATPKHLVTPGNTWSHPGNTWQQLVTPGNNWLPLTANMRA